jgi:hypothetical protein
MRAEPKQLLGLAGVALKRPQSIPLAIEWAEQPPPRIVGHLGAAAEAGEVRKEERLAACTLKGLHAEMIAAK